MKSHLQNYFRQTLIGLAALLCVTSALGQGGDYLYVMRGSTVAMAEKERLCRNFMSVMVKPGQQQLWCKRGQC